MAYMEIEKIPYDFVSIALINHHQFVKDQYTSDCH